MATAIDFDLPRPLVLGHSGGRTSAFQLWKYLDYHGGLPDQVAVVFTNTGREDERALKFIERCSIEWDVPITWLEFTFTPFPDELRLDPHYRQLRRVNIQNRKDKTVRQELHDMIAAAGFPDQAESIRAGREVVDGVQGYRIVNYATASRNREPYQTMLEMKEQYRRDVKGMLGVLPNPSQRLCTGSLKMLPVRLYARDLWGVKKDGFHVALALRADERKDRVENAQSQPIEAGIVHTPLADAGIVAADIAEFWAKQSFQLGMKSYEGNCRECFMKTRPAVERLIREQPDGANWWADWEWRTKDRFRRDRPSYAGIQRQVLSQPLLFDEPDDLETVITCEGGYCSD